MKFQKQTKTLIAVTVAACAAFASFNASAALIIGKKSGANEKQGAIVKLATNPTAGTIIILPGAIPKTVATIITTQTAPAPVTLVPPVTPSAANKVLARTLFRRV